MAGASDQSPEGAGEPLVPGPELEAAPDFYIRVADTGSRILIAQVHLRIGDLVLASGNERALTGSYEIEVPMRSSKNETGGLMLPLEVDLIEYFENGGVLRGRGLSYTRPGAKRLISCEVTPDADSPRRGRLLLEIETEQRVMEFITTYEVVGELPAREGVNRGDIAAGKPSESPAPGGES
jgi:hypothetical protein